MTTKTFILTQEHIDRLLKSNDWMLRFDQNGISYNGFKWAPVGEVTRAPDWNTVPECGHGLHGVNPTAHGFRSTGKRLVLCETHVEQIIIGGDKIKVPEATIIAINDEIPAIFIETCGSLYLRGYEHALPAGLRAARIVT